MLKKVAFPVFSIFLGYQTYKITTFLTTTSPDRLSVLITFVLAYLLTLFITGVFAITGFAYSTHRLLPESYYTVRHPALLKKVYRLLGVKYFRLLLMVAFWGRKKNRKSYFDGTKKGLHNFIYQTKQSEFGHIASFAAIVFLSVVFLSKGYSLMVLLMTLINVIGNLYPVILQRYHRLRIQKIQKAG